MVKFRAHLTPVGKLSSARELQIYLVVTPQLQMHGTIGTCSEK
jgi:hypothetical protein